MAVKVLEQVAGDFNPRTSLEPLLHHRLSHPNIVAMFDVCTQVRGRRGRRGARLRWHVLQARVVPAAVLHACMHKCFARRAGLSAVAALCADAAASSGRRRPTTAAAAMTAAVRAGG